MARNRNKSTDNHSLVSYVPLEHIKNTLSFHSSEIKAFAYIYHDRFSEGDLKDDGTEPEPHWHILIRTWRKHSVRVIADWFWYIDDEGRYVNTLIRDCGTVPGAYDYLIHKRDPHKYQYSPAERVVSDEKWFTVDEYVNQDNAYLAFRLALCGTEPDVIARRCGRDFLWHSAQLYDAVGRQVAWEKVNRYKGRNLLEYDGFGNRNPDYLKELVNPDYLKELEVIK